MKTIVKLAIKEVDRLHGAVYQVGGSLLPHTTRDYDFLVYSHLPVGDILKFWSESYTTMGSSSVKCYEAYGGTDGGKSCVIKLKIDGEEVDLLYVHQDYLSIGVEDYMEDFFPLSIQRKAMRVTTKKVTGNISVNNITFWCDLSNPALKKYIGYYPDAEFTRVERIRCS